MTPQPGCQSWFGEFLLQLRSFQYNSTFRHSYPVSLSRRHEPKKLTCPQLNGFIAQLLEHCSSIAEVMGSNPVEVTWVSTRPNCLKFVQLIVKVIAGVLMYAR